MRKPVLFFVLLFLSALTLTNAINIPIGKNAPSTSTTRQRAPMLIPITVDLSNTDLYLNFTSEVGIVNIIITDNNGSIIYQELADTNSTSELYIPFDSWETGDYNIEITYGSITLVGIFTI